MGLIAASTLGGVGLAFARWNVSHHAIEADSASVLTESSTIYGSQVGVLQQVFVKPGQQVKAGELIAMISNPDLVRRYVAAQQHLVNSKKLDTTSEAAVIPPSIQGNFIPSGPPVDIASLHPLPVIATSGTAKDAKTPAASTTDQTQIEKIKVDLTSARKLLAQCVDTVNAVQEDLDTARRAAKSQSQPSEPLTAAVELAKAKRDKFLGLYTDGIISKAEFQQKEAELNTAKATLAQANQNSGTLEGQIKAKEEDLASANSALIAARANVEKEQQLLSQAQSQAPTNSPTPAPAAPAPPPVFVKPPKPRRFRPMLPPIAPLGVQFSPDKHLEAQLQVDEADRDLKQMEVALRACRVVATTDGMIGSLKATVGQHLTGKSPIVTVVKPMSQRIVASFRHENALRIHYGQPCKISFDAFPNQSFGGRIARFLQPGNKQEPATVEVVLSTNSSALNVLPDHSVAHVSLDLN